MRILLSLSLTAALLLAASDAVRAEDPSTSRDFYAALDELITDFENEIHTGTAEGIENIAIRETTIDDTMPESLKPLLESRVSERILKANPNSKLKQCLACKARRTELKRGRVKIISPMANPAERARIAKQAGIERFLDLKFTYGSKSLTLSLEVTDAESGRVVWARTYRSDGPRVPAKQEIPVGSRRVYQYQAQVQYRLTALYLYEATAEGLVGCLGLGFRMMERYNNRKNEIGFQLDYLKDSTALINSQGATPNLYTSFNLTFFVVHAWNFIGTEENLNAPRFGMYAGVGGSFAPPYLGAAFRVGGEFRAGAHSAVALIVGFRPASSALLTSTVTSVSGIEAGIGVSYLF